MFKSWSWLKVGAVATAVALVVWAGTTLESSLAVRLSHPVCLQTRGSVPVCYTLANTLSNRQTPAIAVSPDGQTLVSSVERTIQVWDLSTGQLQRTLSGHTDWVSALAVSSDGQTLASSSLDQTLRLWNLKTGELIGVLNSGRVTCLEFSPDGQTLASSSRIARWADGKVSRSGIQLWDVVTLRPQETLGSEPVAVLSFSPNGSFLAAGSKKTQLWDLKTRRSLRNLDSGEVTSLVFSPDGRSLISGSSKIKGWQVNTGKQLYTVNSSTSDLALSRDGSLLATSSGGTVNLWQLKTRKLLGTLRGSWYSSLHVAFGQNRRLIAAASDGIKVWQPHVAHPRPIHGLNPPQRDSPAPSSVEPLPVGIDTR